jgi:tRNA 2-thiouridine synthesizing protein E
MNEYYLHIAEAKIETDKEGYLLNSQMWTTEVAKHIASLENIELTEERWRIINFVRDFYIKYDTSPAMRALVNALKEEYGEEKGSSRYLYRLFPKGPAKIATKLAGLPKPAKCL